MTAPSDKRAFWMPQPQAFAEDHMRQHHTEALYRHGEYAMFTLMWNEQDFERGLVDRCPACFVSAGRIAAAYDQGVRGKCPECFGTTFQGGFRAQVIRPTLWTDRQTDHADSERGPLVLDGVTIETVAGFTIRRGDYVFRGNGTRYQTEEGSVLGLRSGFLMPDSASSIAGTISQARLESEKGSPAYLIPPTTPELVQVLRQIPLGLHTPPDLSGYETIRGPLVVEARGA